MLRRFGRYCRPEFTALFLLLALACSRTLADDGSCGSCCGCCEPGGRTYVGVFGGGGCSHLGTSTQTGTVFFDESAGGTLNVHATGGGDTRGAGIVGLQIGHEWSMGPNRGGWGLLPAVELEGFYLGESQRATVVDTGSRIAEHTFVNKLPMNNAAFLANVVLGIRTPCEGITPYFGGGFGTTCVSISDSDSSQVNPPEAGVNHFNSGTDSSQWAIAAQAKVGVRFALTERCYMFTEYRYLLVGSTDHTFGSTVVPGHAATTSWNVHLGSMSHHLGVAGIGFNF